jgi:alpha-L-rhamnosidase
VRTNGYRIGTGFVGTPLICDALCHTGNYAAAYGLLLQRECPSWLYPVTMGATTIWERWDSLLPDGSVNPGEMTSFNHYAFGAVADWLHRTVGGIAPLEPGYRRIAIAPRPGGGLSRASARHLTPYGMAECSWEICDGKMELRVVIPPNASAQVTLPGSDKEPFDIGAGSYAWSYAYKDPDARQPLTIDSTIGEISDDPRAWAVVRSTLARLNQENSFVAIMLASQSSSTLRQALALANADKAALAVEEALAGLGNGESNQ